MFDKRKWIDVEHTRDKRKQSLRRKRFPNGRKPHTQKIFNVFQHYSYTYLGTIPIWHPQNLLIFHTHYYISLRACIILTIVPCCSSICCQWLSFCPSLSLPRASFGRTRLRSNTVTSTCISFKSESFTFVGILNLGSNEGSRDESSSHLRLERETHASFHTGWMVFHLVCVLKCQLSTLPPAL